MKRLNWATAKLPFPGAAPPFGSDKTESEDAEATEEVEASQFSWGTFALDALPDTMTSDPGEHDESVDHSKDGEARDTSVEALTLTGPYTAVTPGGKQVSLKWLAAHECLVGNCIGFMANVVRDAIAAQPGITSPVQNLPPAPPGAAEKAKERTKQGRGIEGGGDTAIDPMSTMDKFNWDNMPLPGMGQI